MLRALTRSRSCRPVLVDTRPRAAAATCLRAATVVLTVLQATALRLARSGAARLRGVVALMEGAVPGRRGAPARRLCDPGMATAEYAVVTVAACAFAGLLLAIVRSPEVRGLLLGIIKRALAV